MATPILLAGVAVMAVGLVLLGIGLHRVASAMRRDLWKFEARLHASASAKTLSDVARRVEEIAHLVQQEAEAARARDTVTADVARRVKDLMDRQAAPSVAPAFAAPRIAQPAPADVVLSWWNQGYYRAADIEGALVRLRGQLPNFDIVRAEMVRGLVGLTFEPALPGHLETIILPDMTVTVGDVRPVFEAPTGTPTEATINRTIALASIETSFHRETRDSLPSYGLRKGRIEPGERV